MKLAEALQERADLNKSIANLRWRLEQVMLVQEGVEPVEDPVALLKTLDESIGRLEYLMAAINHSNDVTEADGMTLTQIIARKDALKLKLTAYKDLAGEAAGNTSRARGTEIRVLPTLKAADLQKEADRMAKEIRRLDNLLQETNWTRELVE